MIQSKELVIILARLLKKKPLLLEPKCSVFGRIENILVYDIMTFGGPFYIVCVYFM